MKISIIGHNVVVECKNGHSSAENINRLLRLNTGQKQIHCRQCPDWIFAYRLKDVLTEMKQNEEKERSIE